MKRNRPLSSINFGSQLKQIPHSSEVVQNMADNKRQKVSTAILSARIHNYSYHENNTNRSNLTLLKKGLFPTKTKIEKEKLTDDNIQAKIKFQKIQEDNKILRQRLADIEKQNKKLNGIIQEVENYVYNENKNKYQNQQQIKNLQKKANAIIKHNKELQKQKIQYEKSSNNLKVQELQVEIQVYEDEIQRLQNIVKNRNIPKRSKIYLEIYQYRSQIKVYEEEIFQNFTRTQILQKNQQMVENKIKQMKKEYKGKEQQIEDLMQKLEDVKNKNNILILSKQIPSQDNQQKIIIQNQSIQQLEQIKQNEQIIENQKQQVSDLNEKIQILGTTQAQEIQDLHQNHASQKENHSNIELKFFQLLNKLLKNEQQDFSEIFREFRMDINKYTKKIKISQNIFSNNQILNQTQNKQDLSKRLQPAVKFDQVKQLGYQIKIQLISFEIDFNTLMQNYIESQCDKSFVSIKNLLEIFEKYPFLIQNPDQRLLICRYLVEDNTKSSFYDAKATIQMHFLKSILRNLIGPYSILNYDQKFQQFEDIAKICHYQKFKLMLAIENIQKISKTDYVCYESFRDIMKHADAEFQDCQIEFMIVKLFESSNDVYKLKFMEIFSIFDEQNIETKFKESIQIQEKNKETIQQNLSN